MKKIALASLSLLLLGTLTPINAENNQTTVIKNRNQQLCQKQDCPFANEPKKTLLQQEKRQQTQALHRATRKEKKIQQRKQDGKGPHHNKEHKQSHKHQHRHQITE